MSDNHSVGSCRRHHAFAGFFFINFSQQGGAHAHPCPFGDYIKICHHNIICKCRWMTFSPLKVEEPLYV